MRGLTPLEVEVLEDAATPPLTEDEASIMDDPTNQDLCSVPDAFTRAGEELERRGCVVRDEYVWGYVWEITVRGRLALRIHYGMRLAS